MLYGIGLILLLMSSAFVGGSALVPVTMAVIGIALMNLGRSEHNGNNTDTER